MTKKGPFFNFPIKWDYAPTTMLKYKKLANQQILMNGLRKKCEKSPFWAIWSKMANFGQFSAKIGKMGSFFKKTAWNILSHLQAITNRKVSEKSNERFSSNRVDARTHAWTRILKVFVGRPKMGKITVSEISIFKYGDRGLISWIIRAKNGFFRLKLLFFD